MWNNTTWKHSLHRVNTLRDKLPCAVKVHLPAEGDIEKGKACRGHRANSFDPRQSVDAAFKRKGNKLFNLLGRHAPCFGHDRDSGLIQIGENIDCGLT